MHNVVVFISFARWLIEAESGRRLNLTMYDFTMTSSAVAMTKATCRRLAVVRDADSGRETNVCSGHERIRQAHVSDGNRVEITMTASSPAGFGSNTNLGPAYFLVHYEGNTNEVSALNWRVLLYSVLVVGRTLALRFVTMCIMTINQLFDGKNWDCKQQKQQLEVAKFSHYRIF